MKPRLWLLGYLILNCGTLLSQNPLTQKEYLLQCQESGVEIPQSLSCLEGEEIQVTRSECDEKGKLLSTQTLTPDEFRKNPQQCDRPSLVQRLSAEVGCIPGDRFSWRKLSSGTLCALVCRRTDLLLSPKEFSDISLICYQPKNGATCFFNSRVTQVPGKGYSEKEVLSPLSVQPGIWKSPAELNESRCVDCHDKSPFLITPNLKDVKNQIYRDYQPVGPYRIVGNRAPFSAPIWKDRYVLNEGNSCTQCHDIGNGIHGGCGHLRDVASGRSHYLKPSSCGFEGGFMPPEAPEDTKALSIDLLRIELCCKDFTSEGKLKAHPLCDWKPL